MDLPDPLKSPLAAEQESEQDIPVKQLSNAEFAQEEAIAAEKADGPKGLRATRPHTDQEKYLKARRWFTVVWTVVGAILLTGVVIYLMNILSLPVGIVIWTVIIVFCLRGIVNRLEKIHVNRVIGTTVAYVVLAIVLAVVVLLMFSPMFGLNNQFADLLQNIPHYVDAISNWINGIYEQYSSFFEDKMVRSFLNDIQGSLSTWATQIAQGSANSIIGAGSILANVLVSLGFALVIAFWVLIELPALGREMTRLIGPKYSEEAQFFHWTFTRVMGGYIRGTILQCAIIGIACGVLFAIVGIPNPAALGGITGILNIIPIIGPWLGGIAAAIVAIFHSWWSAVVAVIGTIIIQQFVYTFISPRIMASSVDIHPAATLLALMVGSAIGGAMNGLLGSLVGMLASIPAVAVMKSIFVYYFERRTGRRIVSEDGVFFKGTPVTGEDDQLDPMGDAHAPHPDSTAAMERIEQAKEERHSVLDRFRHHHSGGDQDKKA